MRQHAVLVGEVELTVLVEHRGLVERLVAGEHPVEPARGRGCRSSGHQHGGDRVAGEVGQRAGLGHEAVDADDEADAVDQVGAVRLQAAGQGGQAGAGDAGGALGGDDHEDQQRDLLADATAACPCASAMNSEAMVR